MNICIQYEKKDFRAATWQIIAQARAILEEYAAKGRTVTLRQLYYQFVSRDLIANSQRSYNRLGSIVSDARVAGALPWDAFEDRARRLLKRHAWDTPAGYIMPDGYRMDPWKDQDWRVEVWVEKEALIGVVDQAAESMRVPAFACKGYVSQTAMWEAGRRAVKYAKAGQDLCIVHLGDHDPSGVDMTRDIQERIQLFAAPLKSDELRTYPNVIVERIALNMDQIEEYDPPPNPAKFTDSRARDYVALYGDESWELDALDPDVMDAMIVEKIGEYRDQAKFMSVIAEEQEGIKQLRMVRDNWDDVVDFLHEENQR